MYFVDLPIEIISQILVALSLPDLLSCQRASSALRAIICDSLVLQYHLAKDKAAVDDNPNCRLPISERLKQLRKRERAWTHFENDFARTVDVQYRSSGIYDLTPSAYILGCAEPIGDPIPSVAIQSARLPSKVDDKVEWSRIDVGRSVVDIGTAIEEHDLIAVVTRVNDVQDSRNASLEIVLLRHSTGQHHDSAQQPIIPVNTGKVNDILNLPGISIEVVGENLAIIFLYPTGDESGDLMFIFDWFTGKQKTTPPIPICNLGLVFLQEDILFHPNIYRRCFDLYHIPYSSENGQVGLIQCLQFPELQEGIEISTISCRADPNPIGRNSSLRYASPTRPFVSRPEEAIVLVTMDMTKFYDVVLHSFSMVVHRRSLLACLLLTSELDPEDTDVREVHWELWGPTRARWFDADSFGTVFITSTSGQRYVSISSDAPHILSPIKILDFNPYRVREARLLSNDIDRSTDINACPSNDMFMFNIESTLPYTTYKSHQYFDYSAVLIDEERIIGLHEQAESVVINRIQVLYFG